MQRGPIEVPNMNICDDLEILKMDGDPGLLVIVF